MSSTQHVTITPGRLCGRVAIPPSKSAAHRAIIAAALSNGRCRVSPIAASDDIVATGNAMAALGAESRSDGSALMICGLHDGNAATKAPASPLLIDCAESGSTLRFLIPIVGALGREAVFTGRGRLAERPMAEYLHCLAQHGMSFSSDCGLPLSSGGRLQPGTYVLPGNISSQYITGLLFALPMLTGDSVITLSSELQSAGYVDLSLAILTEAGIRIDATAHGWAIPGGQHYQARDYKVEGDWSQAAFFLAAATIGGDISISGLKRDSQQGDRAAEELFKQFGASITWDSDGNLHARHNQTRGIAIDAAQIPDLVPALAACAALCPGQTRIFNAERLRAKESDRLAAMQRALSALGADISERDDGLIINGVERLRGAGVDGANDHRIVMACAIAALRADSPVSISHPQSVNKSYPDFFAHFRSIGGSANVHLG
ncbi:MAG: 3-phosphoshikimate 1-carboxyvinyltransferase [Lentisphaeria bacterium]|jgi:3-phosphoshikimate 1-carboxyvinyltransferase